MSSTIQTDPRYSVLPYMMRRMDKVGRRLAFRATTLPQYKAWKRKLIATLKNITGYDTMLPAPLRPRITETMQFEDHSRQRIELQVEPGVIMTLYALIPNAESKKPLPVMICPHGHSSGGKYAPSGRRDIPAIAEQIELMNYDYGVQFVREGFIVFCPDARGFGERMEPSVERWLGGKIVGNSCQYLNQMAYPLGQTVTGMWTWDLHRLIDYIETRKDCDASRVGMGGLSGGGLQTIWATALDDRNRIKAAIVSGYFYGYKQSLLVQHFNCSCNFVPHLHETADMGDLGALIAPRPLFIETGDIDNLNGDNPDGKSLKYGLKNVLSQVKITRAAYRLLNAPQNFSHDIFPGPHMWHGKKSIPWMKQQLAVNAKENG